MRGAPRRRIDDAVEPSSRKVHLTHKKTLIQSELPRILSYTSVELGTVSHGFVTAVQSCATQIHHFLLLRNSQSN